MQNHSFEDCMMCSTHMARTTRLISGNLGAICSDCLMDSVLLLDDEEDPDSKLGFLDKVIIEKLDRSNFPADSVRNLSEYILSQSELSQARRNLILEDVLARGDYLLAIAILTRVPAEQWSHFEATNWIWANSMTGNFEEALKMPEIVVASGTLSNAFDDLHFSLNKITVEIELDKSAQGLNDKLSVLLSIKEKYDADDYPLNNSNFSVLAPTMFSNIASCHFYLGDYSAASRYLAERMRIAKNTNHVELMLGNMAENRGDMESAKAHWSAGLELESRGIYRERLSEKLAIHRSA